MVATEDMVAMEAMAEDTMVKDPLKLMPNQDTSPEDMVDMVMEAMEAMVVMDTMERERPKLSQDMVDMDIAADMDMAAMEAMEAMAVMDTMERERPKLSQDMVDMD